MIKKFIVRFLGSTLGIALSVKYVTNVNFSGSIESLFLAGSILGLLITFVDPILKFLTFPLRLLTLNLFSLVIDMALVWFTQVVAPGFQIEGIIALFWATLLILILNSLLWKILSPLLKS